jgi:hypothetical protein
LLHIKKLENGLKTHYETRNIEGDPTRGVQESKYPHTNIDGVIIAVNNALKYIFKENITCKQHPLHPNILILGQESFENAEIIIKIVIY